MNDLLSMSTQNNQLKLLHHFIYVCVLGELKVNINKDKITRNSLKSSTIHKIVSSMDLTFYRFQKTFFPKHLTMVISQLRRLTIVGRVKICTFF